MNKKANFNILNGLLIGFIGFVLVAVLTIMIVSNMQSTNLICTDPTIPVRSVNNVCQACPTVAGTQFLYFNTTNNFCCNQSVSHCFGQNASAVVEYSGAAYNATKQLKDASILPPQFASIIIIMLLIVGVLSLLAIVGYNTYQKMK